MPYVNVKYQLTADATVSVDELKFGTIDVDIINKDGVTMFPALKVFVDDQISIKLSMSGFAGRWMLSVWVIELDDNDHQVGAWMPCADNNLPAFNDDISSINIVDGLFNIVWQ